MSSHAPVVPALLDPTLQARNIATLLSRFTYRYSNEIHLHDAIAGVLEQAGHDFEREFVLDAHNRADFYLHGLVIEVKVDGSLADALRQVGRYSRFDCVSAVLLAGAVPWARSSLPELPQMNGKAFSLVHLPRRFL